MAVDLHHFWSDTRKSLLFHALRTHTPFFPFLFFLMTSIGLQCDLLRPLRSNSIFSDSAPYHSSAEESRPNQLSLDSIFWFVANQMIFNQKQSAAKKSPHCYPCSPVRTGNKWIWSARPAFIIAKDIFFFCSFSVLSLLCLFCPDLGFLVLCQPFCRSWFAI